MVRHKRTVQAEPASAPDLAPTHRSSVERSRLNVTQEEPQHGSFSVQPGPETGLLSLHDSSRGPSHVADEQSGLDAAAASALQYVQQLLPPDNQVPGAIITEQQPLHQAIADLHLAQPPAPQLQQQSRYAPLEWQHHHQQQQPWAWGPQQYMLQQQQMWVGLPTFLPPPVALHPAAVLVPPPGALVPPPPPPPPPPPHSFSPSPPPAAPPIDITDVNMFPPLTAPAATAANPTLHVAVGAEPPDALPARQLPALDQTAFSAVAAAGHEGEVNGTDAQAESTAVAMSGSEPPAVEAGGPKSIRQASSQHLLDIITSRLTQLTPDWPEALRLAAVEALLLEQQQQQQSDHATTPSVRGEVSVAMLLGKSVPVLGRVMMSAAAAADVSDLVYLRTARRLQVELQACWVAGIPLPDVGGNLLLPDNHGSSIGSSGVNVMSLFNQPPTPSTAAAVTAAAEEGSVSVGAAVQLPRVASQELTLALFSVWGAAPKSTKLISITTAAAVQPVTDTPNSQEPSSGSGMPQVIQLPSGLHSWWASGGLSSTLHSSLQRLTADQQLSSTAALPGQQQALLAVRPHTGVDFGTNQVVVVEAAVQQEPMALQQQKQEKLKGSRQQQGGSGLYVERELLIVNVDTSRTVLLLSVCLAPEYSEWVSLSDQAGIAVDQQQLKQQQQQYTQQPQLEIVQLNGSHSSNCDSSEQQQHEDQVSVVNPGKGAPAAVLLPPGGNYSVTLRLTTSSSRPRSQAELGVISQACFVTAAAAAEEAAATQTNTFSSTVMMGRRSPPTGDAHGGNGTNGGSSSSSFAPPGWHVIVCGIPVAGGLVSQLTELQSVLRADAKPFISTALRGIFMAPPAAGAELAFLPAATDLHWDVHMDRWRLFNGLSFLPAAGQPGLVPAANVAQLTLKRFMAMMTADVRAPGPQPPLLSWGPPVLQQWQRLLLLEEHACERDIASYSVYNIRVAAAVFGAAAAAGGDQQQQQQQGSLRRYSIAPWPMLPQEDAQMYTYRGPELSCLLGAERDARLAVISVPGLPENRPGLITGDVVYLRLASAISLAARPQLVQQLTQQLSAAQTAAASTSLSLQKHLKQRPKQSNRQGMLEWTAAVRRVAESQAAKDQQRDTLLQQEKQEMHKVVLLQQLLAQLQGYGHPGTLHVEVAGLVAAVDGSRCLLAMPDSWWLLLQELHRYDQQQQQGRRGAWGDAPAAADPLLVHACFCLNRTGHGRMQALLPHLAVSPRLLLPPGLLTGTGQGGFGEQQPAAAAAAAAISDDLLATGGTASADKQQQILSSAHSLALAGGVPLNLHQRLAVSTLLAGGGVAAPYVLFGPPGTGKTVTLVEAVLQYRRVHPAARILCCAPANYSADLLCSALAAAGVTVGEMCRLNDPRRPVAQAKQDTLPYCLIRTGLQTFSLDQGLREAGRRPIVVCSTTTAGLLLPQPSSSRPSAAVAIRAPGAPATPAAASSANWWQQQLQSLLGPSGLFDLVVVDESGQGLAPEVLLPLSLAKPKAPVLLAGDPRQLGPVLRSATAAAAGLGVSLLDSWIHYWHTVLPQLAAAAAAREQKQQQQQQKGHAKAPIGKTSVDPIALCYGMLVDNYRSHKRLLDLPSRLFYNGMLRACAPAAAVAPPQWSEIMVSRAGQDGDDGDQIPPTESAAGPHEAAADDLSELCPSSCLFVGVNGQQRQDGDAPSYYNPQEVLVLAELITSLLGTPATSTSTSTAAAAADQGGHDVPAAGGRQAAVSVQDIGVIATYRRQVQKIRLLLRERGLGAVRVGTVDDYQGQEERIIFISTTLSKPESLPPQLPDMATLQQHHHQQRGSDNTLQGHQGTSWGSGPSGLSDVGFWRNPKRFNVAITRAKALLVVVGSPRVLVADDNWRQLLQHCVARGAYRGAGSSFLHKLLRVGAVPAGMDESHNSAVVAADFSDLHEGLLGAGDDECNLASAVQAVVEAAQLGVGAAEVMFPQTLDEYYAACEEDQPWKVAI